MIIDQTFRYSTQPSTELLHIGVRPIYFQANRWHYTCSFYVSLTFISLWTERAFNNYYPTEDRFHLDLQKQSKMTSRTCIRPTHIKDLQEQLLTLHVCNASNQLFAFCKSYTKHMSWIIFDSGNSLISFARWIL